MTAMQTTVVTAPDGAEAPVRRAAQRPMRSRWVVSGTTLVIALVAWGLFAWWIDDIIVPGPVDVFGRVLSITVSGEAFTHLAASLLKILAGFAIAMIGGLAVGFAMGRSQFMTAYSSLPLFVLGNVPGLTYAVFGLVLFGVGPTGPIVVSALVALPFVAMNVAEGVRSVDGKLLDMCRAFGRSQQDIVRHLYMPAVTTFVFSGIRYGFAMAWKVEALTEVFGSHNGVGFMIRRAYSQFQVAEMLAWTMLFVIAMVLIERGLAAAETRLFVWRKDFA